MVSEKLQNLSGYPLADVNPWITFSCALMMLSEYTLLAHEDEHLVRFICHISNGYDCMGLRINRPKHGVFSQ